MEAQANSHRELGVGNLLPNMPDPTQGAFEFPNNIQTLYSPNCFMLPQYSLSSPVAFGSSLSPDVSSNTLILANNQVHASYLVSDSSRVFGPFFSTVDIAGFISPLGDMSNLHPCFEPFNAFIYRINRDSYGIGYGQTPCLDNTCPHCALVIEQFHAGILPSLLCAPEIIPMRSQQFALDAEVAAQVLGFRSTAGFMSNNSWLKNPPEDLLRRRGSVPCSDFHRNYLCSLCHRSFPSGYALGGQMSGHARKIKLEVLLNAGKNLETSTCGSCLEANGGRGFENASVVKVERH